MKPDSISRLSCVCIDLNEITSGEVADHLSQFSDVIAKIIEQVLEATGNPAKVEIMTPEDMACEAAQYGDDHNTFKGQLSINITETFPCK